VTLAPWARTGLLSLLLLLLLNACAEVFQRQSLAAATVLGPAAEKFSISGRFTLTSGERRDHVRFQWEHATESDQVLLMSPLGQGVAQLTRDAQGVRLVRGAQSAVAADSLRQLAERLLGVALPLDQLADWMRGAHGRLDGSSEGWRVRVDDVILLPERTVPRVLEISKGDIEVKLVVDTWETSDVPGTAATP
jgi:outer membrane lipoprotein LolB